MFLKKLLKLIIKKGKKTLAVKNLTKTLQILKFTIAPSEMRFVFRKLAPMVRIYKKKVAGKVYQLPWHISKKRSVFQAAKWIMLAVKAETRGKKLSTKIGKQFVKTLKDNGLAIKLKEQFLDIIRENRSYMRFIRRKFIKRRRKKGFRRFKNRFTKREMNYRLVNLRKKRAYGKNYSKKVNSKNKKHRR